MYLTHEVPYTPLQLVTNLARFEIVFLHLEDNELDQQMAKWTCRADGTYGI